MNIILDDWQKEALDHKGDILLCTGRRIGKTFIMAKKAITRMQKRKTSIIVVSFTEDQAELIIEFARQIAEQECKPMINKKTAFTNRRKITFKNKSRILARPVGTTGDAVRGFDGDILIVDEAARMPELMWRAAKPILLMSGGELWMCSTPAGKSGYFWEQFDKAYNKKDPDARFKAIYKTSEDVVYNRPLSDSWTDQQRTAAIRNLEEEKKDSSELVYGQEYLGLFMEDTQRVYNDEWITQVCQIERGKVNTQNGTFFLGCDIARMGKDAGSYEVVKREHNSIFQVENEVTFNKRTTDTHDKIIQYNQAWNLKKIGIDAGAGALGVGVLDWLLKSEVKRKIVPLSNQSINLDRYGVKKRTLLGADMHDMVVSLGERGILKLFNEESVVASLRSVQYEIVRKQGQKARFSVFYSPHKVSHVMEGIIRAVYLANQKGLNTSIYWF